MGYLPLIIGAVLFVGMVLVIPSEVPENGGVARGPAPEEGEVGVTASGFGETVELCEDRELQAESVYSPPCFTFTGDNGGETSAGVTADTIDVSYRYLADGHLLATLGALAGIDIDEDAEDLYRTVEGLVDYFNQNFEFYGRQINLERYEAVGSSTLELSGGGRDLAQTDALTAVQNESFADVGNGLATSQVYSEILASEGVVTIGAAYMSREWFEARGPHAWSMFPDCTRVAEVNAQVGIERLLAEPAVLAGGDLQDQPRRMGIIHPNQAEYTQCADARHRPDRGCRLRAARAELHHRPGGHRVDGGQHHGPAAGQRHHLGGLRLRPADAAGPRGPRRAAGLLPRMAHPGRRLHRHRPRRPDDRRHRRLPVDPRVRRQPDGRLAGLGHQRGLPRLHLGAATTSRPGPSTSSTGSCTASPSASRWPVRT